MWFMAFSFTPKKCLEPISSVANAFIFRHLYNMRVIAAGNTEAPERHILFRLRHIALDSESPFPYLRRRDTSPQREAIYLEG